MSKWSCEEVENFQDTYIILQVNSGGAETVDSGFSTSLGAQQILINRKSYFSPILTIPNVLSYAQVIMSTSMGKTLIDPLHLYTDVTDIATYQTLACILSQTFETLHFFLPEQFLQINSYMYIWYIISLL